MQRETVAGQIYYPHNTHLVIMKKTIGIILNCIVITFFLFSGGSSSASARVFYVDPQKGSMNGDGSKHKPWSTLEDVWKSNKIETQIWLPPYNGTSLVKKNSDAPVQPGDILQLLSGYHGNLDIIGAVNSKDITIKAAPGAKPEISRISLRSASRWIFDGLRISPSFSNVSNTQPIILIETHNWTGPSSYVTIRNCDLFSVASVDGFTDLDWAKKTTKGIHTSGDHTIIENTKITNVSGGISIYKANNSEVRKTLIFDSGMDGIQVAGSNNVKIEYSTVKNIYSVSKGNHYDMIQAWAIGGEMKGMEIRGNILIASELKDQPYRAPVQGIGLFDGWFNGFIIENNLVVTDSLHGISLYGARNCRVLNNTLSSGNGYPTPGNCPIRVYPHKNGTPGENNIIRNNFASFISVDNKGVPGGVVVDHNISDVATGLFFCKPLTFNYNLKPNSRAINRGSSVEAPDIDILNRKRDNRPDIGAYEYLVSAKCK